MLAILAHLAERFLNWHHHRRVQAARKADPYLAQFTQLEIDQNNFQVAMTGQAIYLLADDAARFLEANHAANYVQFDMIPRLERRLRPVRVTVAWADGEMPAAKAARLEKDLTDLKVAVAGLLQYRDQAGPISFQLEKADDHLRLLREMVDQ